jgi:thymidylate synthase (FAD)
MTIDPYFKVKLIAATPNPNQVVWYAMHQDYSEGFVGNEDPPSEAVAGEIAIKRLLAGNRGHFGVFEHPQITLNAGWFPHSVMQQARTHRIGCCLSGDTVVEFGHPSLKSQGQTFYRSTISHLAKLWHYGRSHQPTERDALYMQRQISSRNILHLNEGNNLVEHTRISNIYANGPREVWLIKLEDGKSIKATKDHKVLTPNGWMTFGGLSVGSEVLTASSSASFEAPMETDIAVEQVEEWKPCKGFSLYEISNHGRVRSWAPRKHRGKLVHPSEPRLKMPTKGASGRYMYVSLATGEGSYARKNVHSLVLESFVGPPPEKAVARHINGNHVDNRLPNLTWGTQAENAADRALHRVTSRKKAIPCKIISIEHAGTEDTYDIEVVGPFHNFIANGIIVHNSFDVQSGRYTSERILRVNKGELPVEEVFYLRPIGEYRDRQGKKYQYTFDERLVDITRCQDAANHYAYRLRCGHSEEHARDLIPYAIRQHFVVSFTLRSLMHFLDLRAKADAQLEIQQLCQLIMPEFEGWTPELADWYKNTRLGKARLAP